MRPKSVAASCLILLSLMLAACQGSETEGGVEIITSGTVVPEPTRPLVTAADLPSQGPAPEILNEVWLNAEEPYTLASQRGKVVLLKFWTFG